MKAQLAKAQALLNLKKPKTDEAMQLLQPIINKKNAPWPAFHFSGIAFVQKGDFATALSFLNEALKQGSDEPETYHAISICYFNMADFEKAEEFANEALKRNPELFKGWLHLGSVYRAQAKLDEALKCFHKANQLDPSSAGVAFRIGQIYDDQGVLDKALKLYDITLKIDKEHVQAYLAKSEILKKQSKYKEAEDTIYEVLSLNPRNIAAKVSLAELYKYKGNYEKAIESYEKLLEQHPKLGAARTNYALCLQELGNYEESEKNYLQAFEDLPSQFESLSNYLMALHYNPNRSKEEIFEAHKLWDQHFAPENRPNRPIPFDASVDKKLRVGFISGGFRAHPVGWMITKALENLPKDAFEIYSYTTHNRYDMVTKRIHAASDKWRSVIGYSDEIIAKIIREDEIDILVELSGHSADTRLKTVVMEPAPVMVKWVGGLFNTTGMESVDYLISDHMETPEGEEEFYTEKLVRMPDDYICFMPPDYSPDVAELPAKKEGVITFGCFNNPTKVNDVTLEKWAEIMNRVPNSRLFLKSKQYDTEALRARITETMATAGISKDRLIFDGLSQHQILLEKYNEVDIALDPWPYSGGLTTCEALWMGVPVITKPGPTFAGRHSATHLYNAGFPEWITNSWDEYIGKVVALASDIQQLSDIRKGLRKKVAASPVCDGARFGAHLSNAFREMWKQRVAGYEQNLPEGAWQDHIEIKAVSKQEIHPKDALEQVDEIEADFIKQETKSVVHAAKAGVNGHSNGQVNGVKASKTEGARETFKMKNKDGVTICTPPDAKMMTPYVLLEQNDWYENELDFIRDYMKSGMNFVDVGAGFGVYALPAAKIAGEEGNVFAFEPGAVTKKHLEMSKLENGFQNLEIIGKAVSKQAGKQNWKLAETPELNNIDESGEEKVHAITLDSWWQFEGEPKVDFLKVDVNGTEADVLQGAKELLKSESPVLMLSVSEQKAEAFVDILKSKGYALYEYIPGPGILAEHELEFGADPYMQNLIAIPENKIEDFKKEGWLHDEGVSPQEVPQDLWKTALSALPWTSDLMKQWEEHGKTEGVLSYLQALNYLIAAEQIEIQNSELKQPRSQKAIMLLSAAQLLIGLYNQGANSTSVVFTLVRTLNALGKRGQAVEVMQKLIETTKLGQENMNVDLPFMLPISEQDHASIKTDLPKWLMVKTVEAWIMLKDLTTFLSGEQEKKLLEVLEGNLELMDEVASVILAQKAFNNQKLSNEERERIIAKVSVQEKKSAGNEVISVSRVKTTNSYSERIFSKKFWNEKFTPAKAKKVVDLTKKFKTGDISKEVLDQVVLETEHRLKEEGTDNVAFFLQTHALLAMNEKLDVKPHLDNELEKALTEKEWLNKSTLYRYWFDKVEYRRVVKEPQVSAIIISNRFKEKSVENLKRLSAQLQGRGEIIFVNNGAEDHEFDALIEYVDTFVKAKGNSGAYLARNLGTVFAKGQYLLFMDDDGIPDEGFVDGHLDIRKEREVIVSRGVYYSDNPENDPWHYDLGEKVKPAVTLLEGNAVYDHSPFYKVGGWGDYILFGHGGMELSVRLLTVQIEREKQVYIPDSKLNHNYYRGKNHQQNKVEKQTRSYFLLHFLNGDLNSQSSAWPDKFNLSDTSLLKDKTTVWLLDPGLHNEKGHHYTYANEFSGFFEGSDEQLCLLTHQLFDGSKIPNAASIGIFRHTPYQFEHNILEGIKKSNEETYTALKSFLSPKIKPGDRVVLHTTGINHLYGIIKWYDELKIRSTVKMSICFQEEMVNRFTSIPKEVSEFSDSLLKQVARFYPNVKICATNQPLADKYEKLLGYSPEVVGCIVKSELLNSRKSHKTSRGNNVLYISSGREVQGVELILELVQKIHQQPADYTITIYTGLMSDPLKKAFKRLSNNNINIIEKGDPSYSYEGLIEKSDAVLLPYDPVHFKDKLSGILLDVLATKTPVITTKGSYLDTFISQFNEKPGVTMESYDGTSLENAVKNFVENAEFYKKAALKSGEFVRENFNAETVIQKTILAS